MRYQLSDISSLSMDELRAVIHAIPEGTTVLSLSDKTDLKKLGKVIINLPQSIKELSFSDVTFIDFEAYDFRKLIRSCSKNICTLDFTNCELTSDKIDQLANVLKYGDIERVYVDDSKVTLDTKLKLLLTLQKNINRKSAEMIQELDSCQQQAETSTPTLNDVMAMPSKNNEKIDAEQCLESLPGNLTTDKALVEWVQVQGAQFNPNVLTLDNKTLLGIAAFYGYQNLTQLLIDKGADVDAALSCGTTPLMQAASKGNIATAHLLLKANAKINVQNKEGDSALIYATENNHADLIDLLIASGAEVNPKGASSSPLFIASKNGAFKIAERLLAAGAIVNDIWTIKLDDDSRSSPCTPLYIAVQNRHRDVAQLLLKYAAQPGLHAKDSKHIPLHVASQMGNIEMVELLLAHGAPVNEVDIDKTTPLMLAAASGHENVIKCLLAAGAKVNLVNNKKYTALYAALEMGYLAVANELMNAGATFIASCSRPREADSSSPQEIIKQLSEQFESGKGIKVTQVGRANSHLHSTNYLYQLFYLSLAMKCPNPVQYALARAVLNKLKEAPDLFKCGTTASFKLWAFSQRKQGKILISLDLSKHGFLRIPPEQLIEIISAYDSDLKGIDLAENFLGNGMPFPLLLATIKALPPTLKYLGLKGTVLRQIPFEQLLELFQALPRLNQLDLRHNNFEFIKTEQCLQLIQALPDSLVKLLFDGNGFDLSYRRREGAAILREVERINARKISASSTSLSSEDSIIENHIELSQLLDRSKRLLFFSSMPSSEPGSSFNNAFSYN